MRLHPLLTFPLLAGTAAAQTFNNPPDAVDVNPDPTIVEVNLTAAETTWQFTPGVDTTVYAYNGTIPGPTIRANVGNTVRVHFTNDLPEATTIHWHGIELPATQDGSHISQNPIPPGGTYTYEFEALSDSFYWYHPHVRPFDQVEKGLYGGVVFRSPGRETDLGIASIPESIVFFDDVLLDAQNQIVPAFSFTDPLQNALYHVNGREGNLLLINGKDASQAVQHVQNGQPQRWRVVNAANTSFCRLDLRDSNQGGIDESVWQIGTDGGLINAPYELHDVTVTSASPDHPKQTLINQMGEGILLLPGERMDVIFTPIGNDQETFSVWQKDWFRGRHAATYNSAGMILLPDDPLDGLYPDQKFLDIVVQGENPGTGEFTPPATLRSFPTVDPPTGILPLTFGHSTPNALGDVTFFVQAEMDSTGMLIPFPAPKITSFKALDVVAGSTMQWEVTNLTHGDHPFHVHGFFFELLEWEFIDDLDPTQNVTFQPQIKRMYKDTIRIPPRLGAKGTSRTIARMLVKFDDTGREGQIEAMGETPTFDPSGAWTSGGWLTHCHILEHSAKGMLTFFEVKEASNPFTLLGRHLDGTNGKISLTATGDLSPGSNVTFQIVNGVPNSTAFLAGGNFPANRPLYGGTFVPGVSANGTTALPNPLFAGIFAIGLDANGEASFSTKVWESAPNGTDMYWQVANKDLGAVQKWAFSNALHFYRP